MIYISHRGNLLGKNLERENSINAINMALNKGFDVEIDVWYDNGFWLGHDEPRYKIHSIFLENTKLWCHAKNILALSKLSKINTRYFWHENDKYTLTSDNIIWSYPGQTLNEITICVLPELNYKNIKEVNNNLDDLRKCYGVCSDYIEDIKNIL